MVRCRVTRAQWVAKVVRYAESQLGVPHGAGWRGTWRDVTNGKARVRLSGSEWVVSVAGKQRSRHDSRTSAIRKARKL